MAHDDFDTQIQPEEFYGDDHGNVCPNCGTDHGTLEDQEYCDMLSEEEGEWINDHGDMDGDHQSGLASAGWGTDEDYGYYGDDNDYDF